MTAPQVFDRKLLLQRRARAARARDCPDFLLRRAVEETGERLQFAGLGPSRVLCLGAYHGVVADAVPPGIQGSGIVCVEASGPLLARCPSQRVRADEEALPFADGTFDLVLSALSLHLVNDLPGALLQIRRVLRPGGLLLGTVLGGATLTELREAFMQAEIDVEGGASPRVAPMAGVRDYGALLQRAGFARPVADVETIEVSYPSPLALMHDLRGMGAANALTARRKAFLRRATLARAVAIYQERFPASGSRVRATFEIVHLAGWSADQGRERG